MPNNKEKIKNGIYDNHQKLIKKSINEKDKEKKYALLKKLCYGLFNSLQKSKELDINYRGYTKITEELNKRGLKINNRDVKECINGYRKILKKRTPGIRYRLPILIKQKVGPYEYYLKFNLWFSPGVSNEKQLLLKERYRQKSGRKLTISKVLQENHLMRLGINVSNYKNLNNWDFEIKSGEELLRKYPSLESRIKSIDELISCWSPKEHYDKVRKWISEIKKELGKEKLTKKEEKKYLRLKDLQERGVKNEEEIIKEWENSSSEELKGMIYEDFRNLRDEVLSEEGIKAGQYTTFEDKEIDNILSKDQEKK